MNTNDQRAFHAHLTACKRAEHLRNAFTDAELDILADCVRVTLLEKHAAMAKVPGFTADEFGIPKLEAMRARIAAALEMDPTE